MKFVDDDDDDVVVFLSCICHLFSLALPNLLIKNFSAGKCDSVSTVYILFMMCSVDHADVIKESAKLTNNLKSFGADQQEVSVTYTYSITFIVRQSYLLVVIMLSL